MTPEQAKADIQAQLAQQAINSLVETLAQTMAQLHAAKAEIERLTAPSAKGP